MRKKLLFGGLLAITAGGCANVHVKKVPVADRLAGRDDCVHGFRYYLTRPYIVVNKRLDLGCELLPVRAYEGVGENGKVSFFKSLIPDPRTKTSRYFESSGIENPALAELKSPKLVAFKAPPKAPDPKTPDPKTPDAKTPDPKSTLPMPAPTGTPNPGTTTPAPKAGGAPNPGAGGTPVDRALTQAQENQQKAGAALNADDGGSTPPPVKALEVVHLPDFEEQYAINNVTGLANSKYGYTFQNGSTLTTAVGNYNSTVVPVELLNSVQNLISAVTAVRAKDLTTLLPNDVVGDGNGAKFEDGSDPTENLFYIKTTQFIEPGIYRLQKSWERHSLEAGPSADHCLGLLTDLGFTISDEALVLTKQEEIDLAAKIAAKKASQK